MNNKALGQALLWTLGSSLFLFMAGFHDLAGLIIIANWVFVVIAGIRMLKK
jgi:hypothetical protein